MTPVLVIQWAAAIAIAACVIGLLFCIGAMIGTIIKSIIKDDY